MILMLENLNNPFADKYYKQIGECIKELNKIFPDAHISKNEAYLIHNVLQKCKWLQKKTITKNNKPYTLYYIGQLRKFNKLPWDDELTHDYYILASNLERELKRSINAFLPTNNSASQQTINSRTSQPQTQSGEKGLSWDDIDERPLESNMEFCNQELLNKYQTENKKYIKITENQLKKLKALL